MRIEIVQATEEHAHALLPRLRKADLMELVDSGVDPLESLLHGVQRSLVATTGIIDGQIAVMGGAVPKRILGDTATCWMLGTPDLDRAPIAMSRYVRHFLAYVEQHYERMECYTDIRYEKALRWVERIGFTPIRHVAAGPNAVVYAHCIRIAHHAANQLHQPA